MIDISSNIAVIRETSSGSELRTNIASGMERWQARQHPAMMSPPQTNRLLQWRPKLQRQIQ